MSFQLVLLNLFICSSKSIYIHTHGSMLKYVIFNGSIWIFYYSQHIENDFQKNTIYHFLVFCWLFYNSSCRSITMPFLLQFCWKGNSFSILLYSGTHFYISFLISEAKQQWNQQDLQQTNSISSYTETGCHCKEKFS